MSVEPPPKNLTDEIVKFWQSWMSTGIETMQRMACPPGAADLQRIVQELGAVRSQVEAMRTGMAALESMVKAQQEMMASVTRSLEEWRDLTKTMWDLSQKVMGTQR